MILLLLFHYFGVLFSLLCSFMVSGDLFCTEAEFSDEKVLARQSRLHGKFSAHLAGTGRAKIFPCNHKGDT